VLKHTNTYSKAELTDKQLSQEQKHGQQYFLDIRPHKLFAVEIISGNKAILSIITLLRLTTISPLAIWRCHKDGHERPMECSNFSL